jgi:hypothetical protein
MSADLLAAEAPQTLPSELPRTEAYYRLKADMEDFLYAEADLLDERRFRDWLNLLAEDLIYFMPIRRNVKFGQHAQRENTIQGSGISWFDEDKWTLTKRVDQILTGVHYAEEPLSRVSHMVSNVQIRRVRGSLSLPCLSEPDRVRDLYVCRQAHRPASQDSRRLEDRAPRDSAGPECPAGKEPEHVLLNGPP